MKNFLKESSGLKKNKMLLHVCCAVCAGHVIELLLPYFELTLFFYNPNIHPKEEYNKRLFELKRLISEEKWNVQIVEGVYDIENFIAVTDRYKKQKEGLERCEECFKLRLEKTMQRAKEMDINYVATTLSISPNKNADIVNKVGRALGLEYKINFLETNFKKNEGYKKTLEIAKKHNLYRQDFCGCIYSAINK